MYLIAAKYLMMNQNLHQVNKNKLKYVIISTWFGGLLDVNLIIAYSL